MKNYWYVSPSRDGWQNLAMDEWFLDHLSPEDMVLYFYINEKAVIIGRNQNPWKECSLSAMEADHVQLVRRITGGGAVYHDCGNLNFSFIAGEKRYDLDRQLRLILQAVSSFGIPCSFTGRNDLLADGKKFSGNAFCARRGIHQHHGTLLLHADLDRLQHYLQVDPMKIRSKGIESVRARVCNLSEFTPAVRTDTMLAAIRSAYAELYGTVEEYIPSAEDTAQIRQYYEKQTSWEWKMGNTMPFDAELNHRFSWGGIQLLLSLKHAVIEQVQVYTDALDTDLAGEITDRLTGCRFDRQDMHAALVSSEKELVRDVARFLLEQKI